MTLCIIPARGGSKRIPRKNIKNFNGKPMIGHSILTAKNSGLFSQIIVSTDDKQIAQVAREYGAEIPFMRPSKLSDDFATTGQVMAHAVDFMLKNSDWQGDEVCCLYATAPFIQAADLQDGIIKLRQTQADFAFSVTSFAFPIQRALKINELGEISMLQPELFTARSQDLTEAWHDAGQFYWGKTIAWLENKPIFNSHSVAVLLPRYRVQDIDTPEDWIRAEMMWHALQKTQAA